MDLLQFIDETILLAINGFSSPLFDTFFIYATWLGWPFIWVFLSLLIFSVKKDKQSLGIFTLALVSVIIVNIDLKFIFNRPRPVKTRVLVTETSPSFPSGHTSIAWCGATALSMRMEKGKLNRPITILLYIVAAIVTYSRMYLGVHYPLDVFTATLEGILVSRTWNMASAAYDESNYQFLANLEKKFLDHCRKITEFLLASLEKVLNWIKDNMPAFFIETTSNRARKTRILADRLVSKGLVSRKSIFWGGSSLLLLVAVLLGILGYVLFTFEEPLTNFASLFLSAGDYYLPRTEISHELLEKMLQSLAVSAMISVITPFFLIFMYLSVRIYQSRTNDQNMVARTAR